MLLPIKPEGGKADHVARANSSSVSLSSGTGSDGESGSGSGSGSGAMATPMSHTVSSSSAAVPGQGSAPAPLGLEGRCEEDDGTRPGGGYTASSHPLPEGMGAYGGGMGAILGPGGPYGPGVVVSPRGSIVGAMEGMAMAAYGAAYALVDSSGQPVGYAPGPYHPGAYPGYPGPGYGVPGGAYSGAYAAYPGAGYLQPVGSTGYLPQVGMGASRSTARFGRGGDGASVCYSTAGGSPRTRAHMKHAASVRALQASPEPVSFASREVAEVAHAPRTGGRHKGHRTQRGDLW
jgi:hypothetical protein